MELVATVAIGLNPYVGTFILAALAAFTRHVPGSGLFDAVPREMLIFIALVAGLAAPFDLVLSKFVRFAPRVRRVAQIAAPAVAAVSAPALSQSDWPPVALAAAGALIAWSIAAMLTAAAARASRSLAWVGLGHVPALMAAATTAACIIPLGLARLGLGLVPAALAVATLVGVTVAGRRAAQPAPRTRALHVTSHQAHPAR